VWRLDRKLEADGLSEVSADAKRGGGLTATSPGGLSAGSPDYPVGNVADEQRRLWREQLAQVGGRSPLLHFVDAPRTRIELSSTHPGGLPQFISGKSTLLSNLIRDDLALRRAKSAAEVIAAKGVELRTVRGIDSIHLAVGLAEWRRDGEEYSAPVLLRPLAIRRYGRDFELKLTGSTVLNPELARALKEQFGITLDAAAFEALATTNGVFKPQPVIDRLRGLTTHLDWFSVQPRLVVSSFADVGTALVRDADDLDHPILDALAGNPGARRLVEGLFSPVDAVGQDDRPPSTDTLLLDADTEQENVIAQITNGHSIVVQTLPGTGGTQTVVNAIGSLVSQHKRVLVVSARRSSLDGIRHRFQKVGLPGLTVHPRSIRRDLIQAITRNEKAVAPRVADVDDALVRLRKVLLDYRGALGHKNPALGVSVLDALEALTRLGNLAEPPGTTARLDLISLEKLATGRPEVAQKLAHAAALGEFQYGPGDSPWYGASFSSTRDAKATHELAKNLHRAELPRLLERGYELIGQTRMRPFDSIEELGTYLRLLLDIRETLDKFQPAVFDRSLGELIAATSSRRDAPAMTSANRRRLKKLAREYVRPGVHIADLNESLRNIQQQRTLWQRYVAAGVTPEVPLGIADVQVAYQRVVEDLARLDVPLKRADGNDRLKTLPIKSLVRLMSGLAADSEVMENLQERTALIQELREKGLNPLITDLSVRHVPESRVADELELAWWQSVLEHVLATDRALLGANTSVIDRLEGDFRLVDEAHASASGALLGALLSDNWKIGLVDWNDEANALRRMLKQERVTPTMLEQQAPHLSRVLAPVWMVSPYEVSQIPSSVRFDTVFLVDAGATTLAENAAAIRRARQVIAVGDPVTQSPTPFEIAVTDGQGALGAFGVGRPGAGSGAAGASGAGSAASDSSAPAKTGAAGAFGAFGSVRRDPLTGAPDAARVDPNPTPVAAPANAARADAIRTEERLSGGSATAGRPAGSTGASTESSAAASDTASEAGSGSGSASDASGAAEGAPSTASSSSASSSSASSSAAEAPRFDAANRAPEVARPVAVSSSTVPNAIVTGTSSDAASASASGRSIGVMADALHPESALAKLSGLLPTLTLTRSYRAGGEDLAQLVNHRFYGGEIESLPWAGSFLGHGSLTLDYVPRGHGMPDPETGGVESVDAEVERVVNLVLEHATERPRESLMVITASDKHAVRVHQAVLSAFAKRSDIAGFILKERAEPFTVLTLEQSVAESRDRVIFSLGYGVTPHGRVLSNFGALGRPGGDRLLAVGMTRARRSMVIVSCIRPDDLDADRMQHGIAALAEILREPDIHRPAPPVTDGAEPMLLDLAERLYRNGLQVEIGYRGKLALVASYGNKAVAIESDPEVASDSLRESLRLRPDVLRRLGWHYLRVHSFDLFSDPEGVARKVMSMLGAVSEPDASNPDDLATGPIAVVSSGRH